MTVPAWQDLVLDAGVLREPATEPGRIVLWVPGESDGDYQYWERVGNVARSEIVVADGLCAVPAATLPARRRIRGILGKLLGTLGAGKTKRSFVLPGGESVEQCGERSTECLLVWPEDAAESLDQDRVESRWPEARRHRRLGPRLFLVDGVAARPNSTAPAPAPPPDLPPADASPRKQAEETLAAARRVGDQVKEVTALTDLGIILLSEGDPRGAINLLEQALPLAQRLGDRDREHDIIGNLGMASLYVKQPQRARQLFERELEYARSVGDVLAEKVAMERMGLSATAVGDPKGGLAWFERALELARRVGDQHQEANLLWLQAIQLAELDQRDAAIARGQESIALFTKLGKPQAGLYGAYLQKYRMGLFDNWPGPAATGVAAGPEAFLGGSLVAGVVNQGAAQEAAKANPKGTTGPGLLRMALSATKSVAQFAGSGFKTTPPDVQRLRLQTCNACEHHTGMRCKICGCFTGAKSRLAHESCPIGKWPA